VYSRSIDIEASLIGLVPEHCASKQEKKNCDTRTENVVGM